MIVKVRNAPFAATGAAGCGGNTRVWAGLDEFVFLPNSRRLLGFARATVADVKNVFLLIFPRLTRGRPMPRCSVASMRARLIATVLRQYTWAVFRVTRTELRKSSGLLSQNKKSAIDQRSPIALVFRARLMARTASGPNTCSPQRSQQSAETATVRPPLTTRRTVLREMAREPQVGQERMGGRSFGRRTALRRDEEVVDFLALLTRDFAFRVEERSAVIATFDDIKPFSVTIAPLAPGS